jgi:hypothetical protein
MSTDHHKKKCHPQNFSIMFSGQNYGDFRRLFLDIVEVNSTVSQTWVIAIQEDRVAVRHDGESRRLGSCMVHHAIKTDSSGTAGGSII